MQRFVDQLAVLLREAANRRLELRNRLRHAPRRLCQDLTEVIVRLCQVRVRPDRRLVLGDGIRCLPVPADKPPQWRTG